MLPPRSLGLQVLEKVNNHGRGTLSRPVERSLWRETEAFNQELRDWPTLEADLQAFRQYPTSQ